MENINKQVRLFLMGGLGNQLFQISFAYAICRELSRPLYILTDSYSDYLRVLSINKDIFPDIYIEFVENKEGIVGRFVREFYRKSQYLFKRSYLEPYFGRIMLKFGLRLGCIYLFDFYHHMIDLNKVKEKTTVSIYGYFQSEKFFQKYSSEVKKCVSEYIRSRSDLSKDFIDKEYIAVSMRLQDDYLNSYNLNLVNSEYYVESVLSLVNKWGIDLVIVTADDYKRAKMIFNDISGVSIKYGEMFNIYAGLEILMNGKVIVVPNSSFSWWGAYLNGVAYEKVFPLKWFRLASSNKDICFGLR